MDTRLSNGYSITGEMGCRMEDTFWYQSVNGKEILKEW